MSDSFLPGLLTFGAGCVVGVFLCKLLEDDDVAQSANELLDTFKDKDENTPEAGAQTPSAPQAETAAGTPETPSAVFEEINALRTHLRQETEKLNRALQALAEKLPYAPCPATADA